MTWALATVAFLLLCFAAVSRRLQAVNITAAMFFTSAGLLAGSVFGLLDISVGSAQVKLIAEITLTLVLFADARGFRCARCAASTRCRCGCLALACH